MGRKPKSAEVRVKFFTARANGATLKEAAAAAGISRTAGHYWLAQSGGVRPRPSKPRPALRLSLEERETISRGLAQKKTFTAIAAKLGRSVSTVSAFAGLPRSMRRSLTWDRGAEMTRHTDFTSATGIPVYFCDAYSPWQRGTNENTNGLLRQYFPKKTDLSLSSTEHLLTIVDELNSRPRQRLGWQTPHEVYRAAAIALAA